MYRIFSFDHRIYTSYRYIRYIRPFRSLYRIRVHYPNAYYCASTVICHYASHWHGIYLGIIFTPLESGGANREGVELCFSVFTTRNAIALCIAASSCLFALPLLILIGLWKIYVIIISSRAIASRCKAALR